LSTLRGLPDEKTSTERLSNLPKSHSELEVEDRIRTLIVFKMAAFARHQWLMSIILATWEAEIGRIEV
jgi:hypothetical protein